MQGKFVVDRVRIGSAIVEQVVVNVAGDSIPEMSVRVAKYVAETRGVPVGPVLNKTRLAFLEAG